MEDSGALFNVNGCSKWIVVCLTLIEIFFPGFYEKSRCSITQIITTNRSIANVSQNKQTKQKTFKNLKVVNTPLGKCPLKFNVEHTVLCNLFFYLEELKIRSNQWKT